MTLAYWFTQHEQGGFPIERAALGSCDLSMLHIDGEWQWLLRQAGRDVAEGAARSAVDAQRQTEAVAAGRHAAGSGPPSIGTLEKSAGQITCAGKY